jgi:O-methyltransferase involved in polyketide biosynthesis
MSKLNADDLSGVSETLLVALHYRVAASRSGSGAFKDVTAERFHDTIAYDWEKFQGHQLPGAGIEAERGSWIVKSGPSWTLIRKAWS